MEEFNRKIRAGSTFLYRKDGVESQIFEVRMKSRIKDNALNDACRMAFKRYPYLNTKLRLHSDGLYYLDKCPFKPIPQRRKRFRALGSMSVQYHIIDITVNKKSIYIAFHHGMCDGLGIMPFIRTLIYYYLSYPNYKRSKLQVPGLRLAKTPLLEGETADPTVDGNFEIDASKVFRYEKPQCFRLPELESEQTHYCRWEIEFTEDDFMKVCKQLNCTPVILTSLMLQKAIAKTNNTDGKTIMSNVVCDWRKVLGVENTFRNCVSCVYLPYGEEEKQLSIGEFGVKSKELLNKQREVDSARTNAMIMKTVADKLESMPYDDRVKMMQQMSGFINDTFTMSYLGRAMMGDMEQYIDGLHIYTSGDRGLTIEMINIAGKFVIDLKQSFLTDKYVNAFMQEFQNIGLNGTVSPRIDFQIPKDKTTSMDLFEYIAYLYRKIRRK
ncbi:MAG: hypothetical protein J6P44_07040 [Bacteroidales bacterium]|nr:hypothetical protein [Bacteroidales bacterium]